MNSKLVKQSTRFLAWLPVVQLSVFGVIISWLLIDLWIAASATHLGLTWDIIWHLTREVAIGVFRGTLAAHGIIWLIINVRPFIRGFAANTQTPLKIILILEIYIVSGLVVLFTPLRPIVQSFDSGEEIPVMFSQFSPVEMFMALVLLSLLCAVALRVTNAIPSSKKAAVLYVVLCVLSFVITPGAQAPDYDYYISRARSIRFLRPAESLLSTEAAYTILDLAQKAESAATEDWQRAYALYNQSRAYFWLGDLGPAEEKALASRKLNPYNTWVHTALADIAIDNGQYREAEAHLEECQKWPELGFPCYADERHLSIAWLEGRLSDAFQILDDMQTTYPKPDYAAHLLDWYTAQAPRYYLDKEEYLAREDAFYETCGSPYVSEACFREFVMLRWGNESFDRAIEAFENVLGNPEAYPFAASVAPLYEEMLADIARMERDQARTKEPVAVFDQKLTR